jgi:hypothetical protein
VFARHSAAGNNARLTYYYDVSACSPGASVPVRLDDPDSEELIRVPRIAGDVVAFEVTGSDGESQYTQLARADITRPLSASLVLAEAGCYACGIFTDLVLTKPGAVAFIERLTKGFRVARCTHRRCLRGNVLTVDRGAGIAPRSLRSHGNTITWVNARKSRSASLP